MTYKSSLLIFCLVCLAARSVPVSSKETCSASKEESCDSKEKSGGEGIGDTIVEDGEIMFCKAMEKLIEMPPHSIPQTIEEIEPHIYLFRKGIDGPGESACNSAGFTAIPDFIAVLNATHEAKTEFAKKVFSKGAETEILITAHGFEGALCNTLEWSKPLINNLMNAKPSASVIFIDWEKGATHPFEVEHPLKMYEQPAVNTEAIGKIAADFLVELATASDIQLNPKNIHAIGFSLGAHAISFFCKRVNQQTGRKCGHMTALDPAGPDFHNRGTDRRVDKSDAEFVDVYHTTFCIGLDQQLGHADYNLNNIHETQPGCHELFTPDQEEGQEGLADDVKTMKSSKAGEAMTFITDHMGGCSHETAPRFYAKSILGSQCSDCDPACFFENSKTLGFHIDPSDHPIGKVQLHRPEEMRCWYNSLS